MYTWAAKEIEKHKGRIAALEQHVAELEKSLENARKERDDWARKASGLESMLREAQSMAEGRAKERDAAIAANAALLGHMRFWERALEDVVANGGSADLGWMDESTARAMLAAIHSPHPGAALLEVVSELRRYQYRDEPDVLATLRRLLTERSRIAHMINPEQHRKALVRARNDGRSSALLEVQRARAKAFQPSEAFALLTYALDCINALKEDES